MKIKEDVLRECAYFSSLIYIDKYKPFKGKAFGYETQYGEVDHIRYGILHEKNSDITYITIRGTGNFWNIITDLIVFCKTKMLTFQKENVTHSQKIQFHKGFLNSAEMIFNQIKEIDMDMNKRKFIFTGHSLGGAVAVVLALLFIENDYHVENVITFGQPKVCKKQDCKFLQWVLGDRFLRVVNNFDLIPNLMTGFWFLFNYAHFGNELRIYSHKTSNYIPFPKSQKEHSFFKQIKKEKVTEHHMNFYIRNLNK